MAEEELLKARPVWRAAPLTGSQGGLAVPQFSCLHMELESQGGKEAGALGREQALAPEGPGNHPLHKLRVRLAPREGRAERADEGRGSFHPLLCPGKV